MKTFDTAPFDSLMKVYEENKRIREECEFKIQDAVKEMAKTLGLEDIKMRNTQEYDSGETYNVMKIQSMKDFDGNELLDLALDYGYIDHDFTHAFEEVEQLEPANSARFIKDGDGSKYDHLDSGEIDNINFGSLALHCLKNGIQREVMGAFLYILFYGKENTPSTWWDD